MKKPIDGGACMWDKRRLFGDNKTWKGLVGMMLGGSVLTVFWGWICGTNSFLTMHNYIYVTRENTIIYNAIIGVMFGLAYALFELPNSFMKRRMDIKPGKTTRGLKKVLFIFMDQADSIFGCVLVVCFVYSMSVQFYFMYVLVGALTHIIINMLLYLVKLRKNMF